MEDRFHEDMMNIYSRAVRECRSYNPHIFMRMVTQHGGLATAKQLLSTREIQYGFDKLWEQNRLDLTVEFHVLQPQYGTLFTEAEREEARRRLSQLGYDVDGSGNLVALR